MPFDPDRRPVLPSLSDAAAGALDGNLLPSPRMLMEQAEQYLLDISRVSYHTGLARLVECARDIAGLRLRGMSPAGDLGLAKYSEVLPHPDLPAVTAKKR